MIRVNLKHYPMFWTQVVARLKEVAGPGALLTADLFQRIVRDEYHLDLTVNSGDQIGIVHFNNDTEFTMFSLRWGFHGG